MTGTGGSKHTHLQNILETILSLPSLDDAGNQKTRKGCIIPCATISKFNTKPFMFSTQITC